MVYVKYFIILSPYFILYEIKYEIKTIKYLIQL